MKILQNTPSYTAGNPPRQRLIASHQAKLRSIQDSFIRSDKLFTPALKFSGKEAFFKAIKAGQLDQMEEQLAQNHPDSHVDEAGNTGLLQAVRYKRNIIARELVDRGANLERSNHNGETPLILAAENRDASSVKYILQELKKQVPHHTNYLQAKTTAGKTALTAATEIGDAQTISLLLKQGRNGGYTEAKKLAFNNGYHNIVDLLKAHESEQVASITVASIVAQEEQRMPTEIVLDHYQNEIPLAQYQGNVSELLDGDTADYIGLRLKEDIPSTENTEAEKISQLQAKVRFATQYNTAAPEVQEFWNKICQFATGQTLPVFIGAEIKGFDSVAGMKGIKEQLRKRFINPLLYQINPESYRRPDGTMPDSMPAQVQGLILHGLPGTGKTYIAKKLAEELKRDPIFISFAEIGSRWYGESAQKIKQAFKQAEELEPKPSFLIMDEIDGVLPRRTDNISQADLQVVNQMLDELQKVKDEKKDIIVIGTTNRYEKLDPAAIRDARFSVHINVPPPDKEARVALFKKYLKEFVPSKTLRFNPEEIERFAGLTRGCSADRVEEICKEASGNASDERADLTSEFVHQVIEAKGPSYPLEEMAKYSDID